jgi:hypothetical protein
MVADECIAARRRHGGDGTGDGHQRAGEIAGVPGGGQGAAALGGLDHDGAAGECGDDAVTSQKLKPAGLMAGRIFADDCAAGGDICQQAAMRAGIRDVGSAGQHGDGDATGGQCAVVRGGVDAVGAAGDNGPAMPCQVRRNGGSGVFAVGGGGPGADDGQRLLAAGPQINGAAYPQRVGPRGAEVIKLRRPAWLAGAYQPDTTGGMPCQGSACGPAGQA